MVMKPHKEDGELLRETKQQEQQQSNYDNREVRKTEGCYSQEIKNEADQCLTVSSGFTHSDCFQVDFSVLHLINNALTSQIKSPFVYFVHLQVYTFWMPQSLPQLGWPFTTTVDQVKVLK